MRCIEKFYTAVTHTSIPIVLDLFIFNLAISQFWRFLLNKSLFLPFADHRERAAGTAAER